MEFSSDDYDKALEFVRMQLDNGKDGEMDLAYYVAMVWNCDNDMKLNDVEVMGG
jgi:hypothetical protein